jgi:FkbM family methyltransferase
MKRLFEFYQINLVLDIGANAGQYGQSLRILEYHGKIISFEPLSQAYKKLVRTADHDANWFIAPRMAIGRSSGDVTINVAANLESSSILPMSSLHSEAAPTSRYKSTETVAMNTLDDAALQYLSPNSVIFLKIDTQGYEDEVLAGATKVLSHAAGVQLEMSLAELYEGQSDYLNLIHYMTTKGFRLVELNPGFSDPQTGHLLQIDGIFINNRYL